MLIKAVFNVAAMERSILAKLFERGSRGQLGGLRDGSPWLVDKGVRRTTHALPEVLVAICTLLGFERIVSKRLGSPYVSGRSRIGSRSRTRGAPAVKREAEEDCAANGDDKSRPERSYS